MRMCSVIVVCFQIWIFIASNITVAPARIAKIKIRSCIFMKECWQLLLERSFFVRKKLHELWLLQDINLNGVDRGSVDCIINCAWLCLVVCLHTSVSICMHMVIPTDLYKLDRPPVLWLDSEPWSHRKLFGGHVGIFKTFARIIRRYVHIRGTYRDHLQLWWVKMH